MSAHAPHPHHPSTPNGPGKPPHPPGFPIFINRVQFRIDQPEQTGAALKAMAGIPLADVLFLSVPGGEDVIIANEATIRLKPGSHLFSQPPADYGATPTVDVGLPEAAIQRPQADGWIFVILPSQVLPEAYRPREVDILVKLPPAFPDAAPDMFWVRPHVLLTNGGAPQATTTEEVLGERWQRFSWHLAAGAWRPGISGFPDFLRCIRGRFARGN